MPTTSSATTSRNGGPKSVRFAASIKRPANDDNEEPQTRTKRPRIERPNPDEDDDIDDWEEEQTDEDLPDSKQLMDVKRERRLRRQGKDAIDTEGFDEETHIDATTSLLSERKDNQQNQDDEFPIEPFDMEAERTDGQGYFDGDTYVFRKRDVDEEPDAWLESLSENKEPFATAAQETDGEESGNDMDDWSREDLYARMIPLVSDTETVLQAVARYGNILKRHKNKNGGSEDATSTQLARTALNDLTEASNALLLKGDVDIYQTTRSDMMKLAPEGSVATDAVKPSIQWEYRGNQDGQLHGPYTTEEMRSWTQSGYFIGEQAVQIRTVSNTPVTEAKSTVDELLSDLMDDDEPKVDGKPVEEVKGEWMSSNNVDFSAFT